jgi:lysophospholipase L1-like esterase
VHPRVLLVLVLAFGALVAAGAGATAPARVFVVGDSLAVGMRPGLEDALPENDLTWDVKGGIGTPTGLRWLRARLEVSTPQALIVSLGTNDGPDPRRFASRIRRVLAAVPRACVVWSTVIRPHRKGPYHQLNRVLRAEARRNHRLVLVDWERAVREGRVALPDTVHPDPAGYRYRSRMFASAVRRGC